MKFLTPQTQRDEYPQKAIRKWNRVLKDNQVRLKNYLYFLLYKALTNQSWTILEWKLAEEGSKLIRFQLPNLYITVTYVLLFMKERKEGWNGSQYHFNQISHWIPREMVRAAYGVGKGQSLNNLLAVQEKLRTDSEALFGDLVLFELGVTEDQRIIHQPQRKRGYHDHGSRVPAHKRGRNIRLPGEPDTDILIIGDNPNEDVKILEILGPTEAYHFFFQER